MSSDASALRQQLRSHLDADSCAWLDKALASIAEQPFAEARALNAFALASRKLRGAAGLAAASLPEALRSLPETGAGALARMVLLTAAVEASGAAAPALVAELFRQGDSDEKCAVLHALPLLDEPARFVDVAVNACRSSVQPVFEAVACDTPYAAQRFGDAAFAQMVLKALFVGIPLERVQGLRERTNPELSRMAHGYASERRAAGRTVPEDIDRFFPR
ncbi:MAG: EboA domain-containing protein [Polyangiaceae bacterium]